MDGNVFIFINEILVYVCCCLRCCLFIDYKGYVKIYIVRYKLIFYLDFMYKLGMLMKFLNIFEISGY